MHWPVSWGFVAASVLITVAPGPDILYVLAKGISQGRRAAVVAACGFASGLTVHTTLAVLGVSALLMASATAFTVLKLLGGAYLLYLGIKAFRSTGLVSVPENGQELSLPRLFAQAFVMNVINPKVALFFLAFLPQFTHPEQGGAGLQLLILGAAFAVQTVVVFSLVGCFSSMLGQFIRSRRRLMRGLDFGVGGLFILLGLRLALARLRD
jgi:threonine/homoserine/homoserine lactone efflux protein